MKRMTGLLSYLIVGVVFYLALVKGTSNPSMFLNPHGLLIVVGGLFAAGLASFPWTVLWNTAKAVIAQMNTKSAVSRVACDELVRASVAYQRGLEHLEKALPGMRTPFVVESVSLVLEGLRREFVREIAEKRIEEHRLQIQTQMNVLLTLSKYSPAMGLGATVLGLVDLLSKLASADLGQLGYGMAVALTATFYGIIFSNMVFAPLSELVASAGEIEVKEMEIVRDAIDAMMEKKSPVMIGEVVNSHLPLGERMDVNASLQRAGEYEARSAA